MRNNVFLLDGIYSLLTHLRVIFAPALYTTIALSHSLKVSRAAARAHTHAHAHTPAARTSFLGEGEGANIIVEQG